MKSFLQPLKTAAAHCGALPAILLVSLFVEAGSAQIPGHQQALMPPQMVSFVGGQLKIDALNVSLSDVLARIVAVTGVKIDIPAEANGQPMPMVKIGPGPAREVLAQLLTGSHLNYLIQESADDAEKIQAVVIMAPAKRSTISAPEPSLQASVREPVRPVDPPANSNTSSAPVGPPTSADAAKQDVAALPPTTDPVLASPQSAATPDTLNGAKVGPQSLPPVLSPEGINQQLQQMYQQRMQINQQTRSASIATPPTSSAGQSTALSEN